MPAAVSDAGPLIHLAQIGKLELLKKIFDDVVMTTGVKVEAVDEGIKRGCPDAYAISEALEEGWLSVEPVSQHLSKTAIELAAGENISRADAETLLLAKKNQAELLVDEKILSTLAKMYKLKAWSTWTLLLEGLSRNLIELTDVETAVNELGKKKFKLNPSQAEEVMTAAKIIEKRKSA